MLLVSLDEIINLHNEQETKTLGGYQTLRSQDPINEETADRSQTRYCQRLNL